LRSGSTIEDASLIDSELQQENGATVTGEINEREDFVFEGFGFVIGVIFWIGVTIFLLVAAIVLAAVAGDQLLRAATALTNELPQTILAAVIIWITLPILAFFLFFTVVGIPLALAIIFFLPILWVLGYIVTGARLGIWLTGLINRPAGSHPYLAAFSGVLLLQLVGLIPVIGWLVSAVAGLWGAGAVALLAWRAVRRKSPEPPPAAQTPV
jgi:hypothetical protein